MTRHDARTARFPLRTWGRLVPLVLLVAGCASPGTRSGGSPEDAQHEHSGEAFIPVGGGEGALEEVARDMNLLEEHGIESSGTWGSGTYRIFAPESQADRAREILSDARRDRGGT